MPLLAFVGLMLEHGMPVSEQTWGRIEAIDAGEKLDVEIARATEWLNDQNKPHAVIPMVRKVCQNQELAESDTHWARLVAIPLTGQVRHMATFAQRWAGQEMGNLGESPRLPHDAQWAWLPCVFDPVDVDKWLTAPRRWIIETVLAGQQQREKLNDSLNLLSKGLNLAPEKNKGDESDGVRLLIGVLVSKDTAWLAPDFTQENDLLHLGGDLHSMADELAKELHVNGLSTDDDAMQDQFSGRYGQSLDDAAHRTSEAIDHEMSLLTLLAANTNVHGVTIEPIYPLAESIGRCALLNLTHAIDGEMSRRHVTAGVIFSEVHFAPGEDTGEGWTTGVTGEGEVWGPYHLQGLAFWEDQVPDMVREVFEDRSPAGQEVALIFHDHPGAFPRGAHRLH